jgi:hypothetical protein
MNIVIPLTPLWFRTRRVFRSASYFQTKVEEAFERDPQIAAHGSFSVGIARPGACRKPELHVFGQVTDPSVRQRALLVAESVAAGTVEIMDDVIVVPARDRKAE